MDALAGSRPFLVPLDSGRPAARLRPVNLSFTSRVNHDRRWLNSG